MVCGVVSIDGDDKSAATRPKAAVPAHGNVQTRPNGRFKLARPPPAAAPAGLCEPSAPFLRDASEYTIAHSSRHRDVQKECGTIYTLDDETVEVMEAVCALYRVYQTKFACPADPCESPLFLRCAYSAHTF